MASLGGAKLDRLNEFRIVREIGRGGMGIVYEAEQESLGRRVAVKVLPRQSLLEKKQLQRFQREARAAAKLHHTNIVPVFGVGESRGFHYYVMQYIDGVGLDEILAESWNTERGENSRNLPSHGSQTWDTGVQESTGTHSDSHVSADTPPSRQDAPASDLELRPPPEERPGYFAPVPIHDFKTIANIGIQAAKALQFAHDQGMLHRDVKPGNLLLDSMGVVWVADFGLVTAIEGPDVSQSGNVVGTLRYMAPERFQGRSDARSDVYSLGLTLYELLTRRPAWNASDRSHLVEQVIRGDLLRARRINPLIPRDLETIVMKATARDPAHRYRMASDLAADLECYLEGRPIRARRSSSAERLWRWCRRNPIIAGLSTATAVLLVLVAVMATIGYRGERIQREGAEARSDLALTALDEIFERLSPASTTAASQLAVSDEAGENAGVSSEPALSKDVALLLQDLLKFYDKLAEEADDNENQRLRAKSALARVRVGDIHQRLGHYEQSVEAYQRAIVRYRQIHGSSELEPDALRLQTAFIHNEIGKVERMMGRGEESVASHGSALEILNTLSAEGSLWPETRFELARTHYLLARKLRPGEGPSSTGSQEHEPPDHFPPRGRFRPAERRPDGPPPRFARRPPRRDEFRGPPLVGRSPGGRRLAPEDEENFQNAIGILEGLVSEHPTVGRYRHLLALCFRELAPDRFADGAKSNGESIQRAIDLLETLVEDFSDIPEYRHALAETYSSFDVRRRSVEESDFAVAEEALITALGHAKRLVDDYANVPAYAISLIHIYHKLAYVQQQMAKFTEPEIHRTRIAEAERSLRAAAELQSVLIRRFPDAPAYKMWLARFQSSLARLLRDEGRFDESRAVSESAISSLEAELQPELETPNLHRSLVSQYRNLAETLDQMGETALAMEASLNADEHRKQAGLNADNRSDQTGDTNGRPEPE
jgi:serine/threonine protein kinase